MRRDKNAPRLYELLGQRDEGDSRERLPRPAPERSLPVRTDGDSDAPKSWLTPGRTIRVPVGYVFLGVAVVVLSGMLGYFTGYAKHRGETRREQERQAALNSPDAEGGGAGSIRDPLNGASDGSLPDRPAVQNPAPAGGTPSGAAGGSRALIIEAGDPDPRVPGLNYFVAARLPPENASQAAIYLTSRGIPSARLAPDADNWCKVVALRGFDASTVRGPDAEKLADQIRAIGRDFKRIERGGDDFASTYPEKYTGN